MKQHNNTKQASYYLTVNYQWNYHAYFLQGFSLEEYQGRAKGDVNKQNQQNPSISRLCNSWFVNDKSDWDGCTSSSGMLRPFLLHGTLFAAFHE